MGEPNADQSKVHVYRATREDRLIQLVCFLWGQLRLYAPTDDLGDIETGIETAGMGWAIPYWERRDPDDWLTVTEIADELGYTASTIRNWPARYGLQPAAGRYRWGDIQEALTERRRA